MEEFLEALRELRQVTRELRAQALDTERALDKVINKSNLRGTLTMMQNDIFIRDVLNQL